MRKVLITRYGAFGDQIHASHLPRLLKEKVGFDYVAFEYNPKGSAIHKNNPFIDEHIFHDPFQFPFFQLPQSFYEKRWTLLKEQGGFEKHINLQESIERAYIAMEDQSEYYMSSKTRREKFGKLNYYDQTTKWAGYPEHMGTVGQLFFSMDEEATIHEIYEREYKGKFVIIANLSGTSKHKLFYNAEEIIKTFLARHEDAVCITVGDEDCRNLVEFHGERIVNRCGNFNENGDHTGGKRYPFRQSMLMAKYADLVIGAESGLMVASTLLGAPTVQLMTVASLKNHGGDFVNDFSLQSPAPCSPCHKGPYDYIGCHKFAHLDLEYPICIKFEQQAILNRMEEVYAGHTERNAGFQRSAERGLLELPVEQQQ